MERSRRSLLTAAGVAGTTLLGGCLRFAGGDGSSDGESDGAGSDGSSGGDGGSDGGDGDASTPTAMPAPERPEYAKWLVAPSELPFEGVEHYEFGALKPSQFDAYSETLPSDPVNVIRDFTLEIAGLEPSVVDRAVFLSDEFMFGLTGSFTSDDVVSSDRFSEYEQADSYGDYDVYRSGERLAFAVRDGTLALTRLTASAETDLRTWLETVIDTERGDKSRYPEVRDDCALLVDGAGDGDFALGRTVPAQERGELAGRVGDISRWRFGEEMTDFKSVLAFESESAADPAAVQSVADMQEEYFSAYFDRSISQSERTVIAEATVPTENFTELEPPWPAPGEPGGGGGSNAPQASFSFNYAETTDSGGYVEITHDGGDVIRAEELTIRGDGFADTRASTDETIHMVRPGQWPAEQTTGDDEVTAGISVRVGVRSDYDLSVVWQSGEDSAVLATGEGPDA
jgi:hypothetical protein